MICCHSAKGRCDEDRNLLDRESVNGKQALSGCTWAAGLCSYACVLQAWRVGSLRLDILTDETVALQPIGTAVKPLAA